jgi:hypothetical protein
MTELQRSILSVLRTYIRRGGDMNELLNALYNKFPMSAEEKEFFQEYEQDLV